jgi:hypothetical protein
VATKTKTTKKPKCGVGIIRSCHGEGVRRMTGPKKGDPVFNICMGCWADLHRQGVKLKEA